MVDVPAKTRPRLFLIDGYALIYRAFFAMINAPLTTSRGENTSAAFGFTRFLLKILEEHEPDYLGVVMDAGMSDREKLYPEYKATREKMPDELAASMPRIRQLMEGFRVPVLELDGQEADDVIGTLATLACDAGVESVIVSGDKDFYQLICPDIALLNPGRGGPHGVDEEWVDTRNAAERLGVPPERIIDYLALIGDSSDNVPGARGIGPKTALKLIQEYGGVEEILAAAPNLKGKRAREALLEHADNVRLSRQLVTIRKDLPLELDLARLKVAEPDRGRLRDLFMELEFRSLAREYAAGAEDAPEPLEERDYRLVRESAEVAEVVRAARAAGQVCVDCETTSLDPLRCAIVGISLAIEPGTAWYLPFRHTRPGELDLGDHGGVNLPPLGSAEMRPLVELLEDPEVGKVGQNLKYDMLALRRAGVTLRGLAFDTMLASYVLDPGRREHGMDALSLTFLNHRTTTYSDLCGKGKDQVPIAECDVERVKDYACEDVDVPLRLQAIFAEDLEQAELRKLFDDIEMPLIPVLAEMEWAGIAIDEDFFGRMQEKLGTELQLIQEEIWKIAGEEFNINSTPQLREILFERQGLPVIKKTKTGPSTDVSVLEELAAQGHELPLQLMQFRQVDKLKGTYVDALPRMVNPETGRIHTSFAQTVAATGRLSSVDPNLQNIPIRTEMGAEIRKGFVPAPGHRFVSADYSQIELRVLAHLAGDPAFVEAFRAGRDIHRETAAVIFGVASEDVSPKQRDAAKTVNFATIYGIGPFMLAQKLGTSQAEAKAFIEQYFERFADVRRWLDEQIARAREQGYVETITGRRRYVPEVHAKNWNIRQFGERAATNAPVQGSAADIIKIAMIDLHAALASPDHEPGIRMLLQVHDELVLEVPEGRVDEARALVVERMENAVALDVPLAVSTGVGANWFECK